MQRTTASKQPTPRSRSLAPIPAPYFIRDSLGNLSQPAQTIVTKPDQYEIDDAPHFAHHLLLRSPELHNLHRPKDCDWVEIAASTGHVYQLNVTLIGDAERSDPFHLQT